MVKASAGFLRTAILVFIAALAEGAACGQQMPASVLAFDQHLQQFVGAAADPCDIPGTYTEVTRDEESAVFSDAARLVEQELNASASQAAGPTRAATKVLSTLEHESGRINGAWPQEARFHSEVISLPPLLVVKMSYRAQARYFAFAASEGKSERPRHPWEEVGSDSVFLQREVPDLWLDLYPLRSSRSGRPRFLARFGISGCAGSYAIEYDVEQWSPDPGVGLEQILQQEGAVGLDDRTFGRPTPKEPFPLVGELQTTGPLLKLPYCWFSALDTWDDPSLCALDSYDLSGDEIRFISRVYNRPDLVPIAKAIEYAEKRDLPAVRGYCASDAVARKMVSFVAYGTGAEDLQVRKTGPGRESVAFGGDPTYRFDVERRGRSWVVSAFHTE